MIAIRPPAYFPPLAYTALLQHVDHFIIADTFRFRRKMLQNRSKLRNAQGTHWITIPLFGQPDGAPIYTVEIETGGRWREKHWRSFMYDYRTTMYFEFYEDTFKPFFDVTWENLADCTCRSIEVQADIFGLKTEVTRASTLEGRPETTSEIVETMDAETLCIPADEGELSLETVEVERFQYTHPTYHQNFEGFEAGVTAIDLAFNYGREAPQLLAKGAETTASAAAEGT